MYNQFFTIKPRISEKNGGSKVVHLILETFNWKVLPHPAYSPDLAPSDYLTCFRRWVTRSLSGTLIFTKTSENGLMSDLPRKMRNFFGVIYTNCLKDGKNVQLAGANYLNKFVFAF